MINEMATIQTDLKLENHIKDFTTTLKHNNNNCNISSSNSSNGHTLTGAGTMTTMKRVAATATASSTSLTNFDSQNIMDNIKGKLYIFFFIKFVKDI